MNKTKIDWADSTWNPVTGCLHGCEYCYARNMVHRFTKYESYGMEPKILEKPYCRLGVADDDYYRDPYPYGFAPTFHRYRLNDYKDKKGRIIFVGSMCDLFGDWVPDKWIEEVFKACEAAPQHKYLFLTKNPERYQQLKRLERLPQNSNMWYGQSSTKKTDKLWTGTPGHNIFISHEPILEPLAESPCGFPGMKNIKWVIIGAETGRRKDKVIPEQWWIKNIVSQWHLVDVPVFMKESLHELMGDDFVQEWPKELGK